MILGLTIETAFLGPTDTKGSRIIATCKRDSDKTYRKVCNWDHRLSSSDNHQVCATALMAVMDADLACDDSDPFRIVARGFGGRSDAGYHFIINRG